MTGLPPGTTTTRSGVDGEALAGGRVGGDRLAQLGDADGRRVVGRAAIERPLGRLADVGRGVEVGLADLEVDDRAAGGLERPGSGRRLEGGLGADAVHPFSEFHRCLLVDVGRPRRAALPADARLLRPSMAAAHAQVKFSFLT